MNIIACGPTGATWDGIGPSIGVNDCEKFGKPVDALVCVNLKFELDRYKIIRNTKAPDGFYSQLMFWAKMPTFKLLPTMKKFAKNDKVDHSKFIYSSKTSPFVAVSLAIYLGHKEIVLYGADYEDHPIVKGNVLFDEVEAFKRFADRLPDVRIFLANDYGALRGVFDVLHHNAN